MGRFADTWAFLGRNPAFNKVLALSSLEGLPIEAQPGLVNRGVAASVGYFKTWATLYVREFNSPQTSIDSFRPPVHVSYVTLAASGKKGTWISGGRSIGRPKLGILDHDSLGQPGEYARIHDYWLTQKRHATPFELV